MEYDILESSNSLKPEVLSPEGALKARERVREASRDFKDSWRNLARALTFVWSRRLYLQWGYEKFDDYTAKEVSVRKSTAMKLIRSYQFLRREEIEYEREDAAPGAKGALPGLEEVAALRRAKTQLPESDYRKIKQYILEDKKDIGQVKKDLTALIKERKPQDSEKERNTARRAAIRKILHALRSFKRDVDMLKYLPGSIGDEIEALARKIEKHA